MFDYSKTAYELKRSISNFAARISRGLPVPVKKFITCMIFGIIASKTVLLSNISRSLNEPILLKKTIERLSRNLEKFCYKDNLLSNLSHEVKGYIRDDTPIIIDLSDVVKKYHSLKFAIRLKKNRNVIYNGTEYILSTYNKNLKCELPLYLRMVQASRFDGVSAVVALQEAQLLYDEYIIDSFHGDGAHDNYAMYHYLHECNIKAFIPLNETNKGNFKHPSYIRVDENGVPICMAGHKTVFWGFNKDRCRLKYRCPLATGKISSCPYKEQCSPSDYGRCFYTKPSWDLRLFTQVPRGSNEWKEQMNSRTSSERVNKRLLNDYGLELSRTRGKKRIFWWSVVHSLNIHLDARLKVSDFSFVKLLQGLLATPA